MFGFKHPLTTHDINVKRSRNKGLGFVMLKGIIFVKHGLTPLRIFVGLREGGGVVKGRR